MKSPDRDNGGSTKMPRRTFLRLAGTAMLSSVATAGCSQRVVEALENLPEMPTETLVPTAEKMTTKVVEEAREKEAIETRAVETKVPQKVEEEQVAEQAVKMYQVTYDRKGDPIVTGGDFQNIIIDSTAEVGVEGLVSRAAKHMGGNGGDFKMVVLQDGRRNYLWAKKAGFLTFIPVVFGTDNEAATIDFPSERTVYGIRSGEYIGVLDKDELLGLQMAVCNQEGEITVEAVWPEFAIPDKEGNLEAQPVDWAATLRDSGYKIKGWKLVADKAAEAKTMVEEAKMLIDKAEREDTNIAAQEYRLQAMELRKKANEIYKTLNGVFEYGVESGETLYGALKEVNRTLELRKAKKASGDESVGDNGLTRDSYIVDFVEEDGVFRVGVKQGWPEPTAVPETTKAPESLAPNLEKYGLTYDPETKKYYEGGEYRGELIEYKLDGKGTIGIVLVGSVVEKMMNEVNTPEAIQAGNWKIAFPLDPRGESELAINVLLPGSGWDSFGVLGISTNARLVQPFPVSREVSSTGVGFSGGLTSIISTPEVFAKGESDNGVIFNRPKNSKAVNGNVSFGDVVVIGIKGIIEKYGVSAIVSLSSGPSKEIGEDTVITDNILCLGDKMVFLAAK